ncbi:ABC transporter ATP-binding protein [Kitasatospora sp. NE20-6]|uniref:ATP-binding cassette domain-containing protein n=1 Tax=Kitasatospora sp. NE20-6 TaxID=2859066 RepID=UPI0034DBC5AD
MAAGRHAPAPAPGTGEPRTGHRTDHRTGHRRRLLLHGRRWSAVLALAVAGSTTATLLLPAVLADAVDRALSGRGAAAAVPLLTVLVLLAGAECAGQYAGPRATADATAHLRAAMVRRVVAAGAHPAHRLPAGDLVARLTGSAPEAALAAPAVVWSAAQLLMAVGAVAALALLAVPLALAFLVSAPAAYLLVRGHLRRTARLGEGYQRAQAAVAAGLVDALTGARSIAASGTADREIERVLRPVPELSRHGRALWESQRRVAWATALLAPATQLAVLATAGVELTAGRLTVGGLLAALGYTGIGLSGFGTAQSLLDLSRARAGAARVRDVLETPVPAAGTRPLPDGDGRLDLRGIVVRRSGAAVLDGLALTVPGGTWVAVVGVSGSGTSLLAALAGGLLAPDEGEVLLDGVPLREIRPEVLRTAVAYGFPDPVLPGRTVEDAIGLGPVPVPGGVVRHAAEAAQADAFVRRLPAGYGTAVPLVPLSGGERQRLGLARAFARRARLLVLDDATSSLDTATETAVLRAVADGRAGHTRLTVTRRASTAARADAVAWLHEGRIRALAPHAELWPDPAYRRLFGGGPASTDAAL